VARQVPVINKSVLFQDLFTSWKKIKHHSSNQIQPNWNLENIIPGTWKYSNDN